MKGLYESLVCGDITEIDYRDMKQSYETQIAELTKREKQLREESRERHLKQITVNKASMKLNAVNVLSDITAAVIDALIDKIVVFEDKHIEVRFKFTDEISEGSVAK